MNIGITDRVVRIIDGLIIVIIDFIASGALELAFVALGLWSVLTIPFGWCHFYKLIKIKPSTLTQVTTS